MLSRRNTDICTSEDSTSSMEMTSENDTVQYGPIAVQLRRKPAPTLETGRRSKHLVLVGDEAARREKRRERNREAARKLKEKRLLIEEELNRTLKDLQGQHSDLQKYLRFLHQRKQLLEDAMNDVQLNSLDDLLSNESFDKPLFFKQCSENLNLADDSIESFLDALLQD